jgi:thymidylate synthase (FAD)
MSTKYTKDGVGFISVVDKLGDDTTIVNAARVSFGKTIKEIRNQDKVLLYYLASHKHTSPFRHAIIQFHIKAPEVVARQAFKHIIGSDYAFKDTAWNEISGRYVEYKVESYLPTRLRKQSKDNKQGSSGEVVEDPRLLEEFKEQVESCFALYQKMVDAGVAKEQARMILPLTFYTEWYWTASLQAVHHFVKLRQDVHAQAEIREYADIMASHAAQLYPSAWEALTKV